MQSAVRACFHNNKMKSDLVNMNSALINSPLERKMRNLAFIVVGKKAEGKNTPETTPLVLLART